MAKAALYLATVVGTMWCMVGCASKVPTDFGVFGDEPDVFVGPISLDDFKTWAEEPSAERYGGPYAGMQESSLCELLGAPDALQIESISGWCCTRRFAFPADFPRNGWSPDTVRTAFYLDLNQAIVFRCGTVAGVSRLSDDAMMQYLVRRKVHPDYRDPAFDGLWTRD